MTTTAQFENLLRQVIGLDAASVGPALIERAVKDRQTRCGDASLEQYWAHVTAPGRELQELIDAVVVPETWFFRHRESFAALTGVALTEWMRRRALGAATSPFRLLSLPCSSGEEPYSMAMALLDAGLPRASFSIDAMDISRRALRNARRALYGRNSFRGDDIAFRERHFTPMGQEWRASKALRQQVKFRHGNLFEPPLEGGYDVVFCRNVLIYFDRPTQDRAVGAISRLLAPEGLLFVGPSETSLLQNHHFVSAKVPLAFAFRKGDAPAVATAMAPPAAPAPRALPPVLSRPSPAPQRPAPQAAVPVMATGGIADQTPEKVLDRAAQFADEGRLPDAAQLCQQYLAAYGPGARVLYLLGLLRDAAGDMDGAAEHYRKALYLAPQHEETLNQFALLLEKQGDSEGARRLRGRSERLLSKRRAGS